MTATTTGAYVDPTNESAIEAQITSLGVAGNLVIVVPAGPHKVWIGKCIIT